MKTPQDWHAAAFNTSPDSDNQIHSDVLAQTYGFRGGLVPGVVVSAYLINPAVKAWGLDWLTRGHADIMVQKPTYDGENFTVGLSQVSTASYHGALSNPGGVLNASAEISLCATLPEPPTMRGDPLRLPQHDLEPASIDVMQRLREQGMQAMIARWDKSNEMSSYLRDPDAMPALHRFDGGGFANAAFMLGLTNWVLAGNVYLNPWIHLQTKSQFYAPVADGTQLHVECDIHDLFSKRGHEFVDLNVNVYVQETAQPVMSALLRAIYKLRTAAAV